MIKSQLLLLIPFFIAFVLVSYGAKDFKLPTSTADTREVAQVVSITDGDTFRVSLNGQEKIVRFIGIDTPEISRTPECFGQEAKHFLTSLLAGKTVYMEKDVSETDRYQRLLRYVYVDDVFVNKYLVEQGYATAATFPPDVKYQDVFSAAEYLARTSNQGLWSLCNKN